MPGALRVSLLVLLTKVRAAAAILRVPQAPENVRQSLRDVWPEECMPDQPQLQLARATDEKPQTSFGVAEADTPPKSGDVFVGTLERCAKGKQTGFRLAVESWPSSARVGFFPWAHWNNHERVFQKPTHNKSGEWRVTGSGSGDLNFRVAGEPKGGKLQFGLAGRLAGDSFEGQLVWQGHEHEPDFVPQRLEDYPFFCSAVQARRCTGTPPTADEKVVVFMRHAAAACDSESSDPFITGIGEEQVKERMFDANLARALSADPRQRAQVIVVSPLSRAIHTALLAFSQRLPQARWVLDSNLVELGGMGSVGLGVGERLLRNCSVPGLLEQYHSMTRLAIAESREKPDSRHLHRHPHQSHETNLVETLEAQDGPELEDRFQRFTENLLEQPEERFIVVSHRHILKAGIGVSLDQTATHVMALSPGGVWRHVPQPPQCWPDAL